MSDLLVSIKFNDSFVRQKEPVHVLRTSQWNILPIPANICLWLSPIFTLIPKPAALKVSRDPWVHEAKIIFVTLQQRWSLPL